MLDWALNMPLELVHFECSNSTFFLKMIKVFEVSIYHFKQVLFSVSILAFLYKRLKEFELKN